MALLTNKTYQYIIVCKPRNFLLVDLFSRLLLMFAIASFGFTISKLGIGSETYLLLGVTIAIIGWWIYSLFQKRKGKTPYFRVGLLIAAFGWFLLLKWHYLFFGYFIVAMLEKQVKFPEEIAFDEEGILVNSLPKKQYSWNQLNQVLIKEGLLTIDFKNNKIIQKEIAADEDQKIEVEFNQFCKNNIQ